MYLSDIQHKNRTSTKALCPEILTILDFGGAPTHFLHTYTPDGLYTIGLIELSNQFKKNFYLKKFL